MGTEELELDLDDEGVKGRELLTNMGVGGVLYERTRRIIPKYSPL